ncbi:MAG: hypothetical protein LBE38_10935 [Deltaproteobacteria bacterium]|jgi:hypothetical protein|nr:hypothetical protein [Deltaproteobacteria bacterium]
MIFKVASALGLNLPAFYLVDTPSSTVKTFSLAYNKFFLMLDRHKNLMFQVLFSHKMFINWSSFEAKVNFTGDIIHILGHLGETKKALEADKLYVASRHIKSLISGLENNGLMVERLPKNVLITRPDQNHPRFKTAFKAIENDLTNLEPPFMVATPKPIVEQVIETTLFC